MNFDTFVAAAIAAEARRAVATAWVESIYQPEDRLVILGFYGRGGKTRWAFSADAARPGVYRTERRRPNPPSAPGFCMLLRKYLEGARLTGVETVGFDRILRWRFERSDGAALLIAEIMGKHSNLILTDLDGLILGAVKPVPAHLSRVRQVLPGLPYQPPPASDRPDPRSLDRETFRAQVGDAALDERWLTAHLAGFGPFAAREVLARAVESCSLPTCSPGADAVWIALKAVMEEVKAERFQPTLFVSPGGAPHGFWAFPARHRPAPDQQPAAIMSAAIEAVYDQAAAVEDEALTRKELLAAVRSAQERSSRQQQRVEEDLAGEARAEAWRVEGELLTANLHRARRGDTEVEVIDYYDPEQKPRVIALDPELTPQENAERAFRRHRKAIDAALAALEQADTIQARHRMLSDLKERVERAAPEDLVSLRREVATLGLFREGGESQREKRKVTPEYPPGVRIRRTTADGWEILHGENATSNDYLTTRVARPDDLWLHVRAAASAHVVIRTGGRADRVPPHVLEQAARIAAAHSESKHSGLVPVDYVLRKHVRKPRRSAPGLVTYQNEKTLYISPGE
jgi:predicted ribosome quality control (RQC) complex YloA/Tae2 family protein